MKEFLKRLLWLTPVVPVTHNDVPPAARPLEKEREIKDAQALLVNGVMGLERKASEIRLTLAGAALDIVSGDR